MDQRELIGERQEALRAIVEAQLLNTWTALPGIIQNFDPTTGRCTVQPAPQLQTLAVNLAPTPGEDQTTQVPITLVPIPHVLLISIGGGGFVVECEPQNGDECLLIFSSRCIDGWWRSGGVQPQPVLRHHSLSDAFAIVGPFSQPNVFTSLGPGLRLRKKDGSAYIELLASGAVNIVAPGGVNITGNLAVAGTVTATEEGTFGATAIPVSTHVHPGVAAGGASTGEPIA